jgi:hypothetical protein
MLDFLLPVNGGVCPCREQEKLKVSTGTRTFKPHQTADISQTSQTAILTTRLHRNILLTMLLVYVTLKRHEAPKRKLFGMSDGGDLGQLY